MIIGIDGNEANIKNRVGVGQYAFNILNSLYHLDNQNQYLIYLKEAPLSDLPKEKNNWHYRVFGPKKLWTKFALPLHLFTQKEKLNLFYSPSHYSPQFSPFPTVPTIHDLGYLKFQQQFNKKDLYQLINWTKDSIKKAAHIVTVSDFSKKEIEKTYQIVSDKISIAYNGVSEPGKIDIKTQKEILASFKIEAQKYFLYLGTLKPNKNLPFLIESFSLFLKENKDDFKLVIAGKKGWLFDEIFETVKKEKMQDSVVFTDFVSETQKTTLYQNSKALIMPSIYEGFGIPIIEAMKLMTPVICSDIPPLKEVAKDTVFYFNPADKKDLVKKLIDFQKIDSLKLKKITQLAKSRADFFTWDNSAKTLVTLFKKFS